MISPAPHNVKPLYSILRLRLSLDGGQSPPLSNLAGGAKHCFAPPEHFIGIDIFNDKML
jgi:hypothetical protein